MSRHEASVRWTRGQEPFVDNRYARAHEWAFDGGAVVHASAAAANVPAGTADPAAVDPEEGFLASLASCHMLWFLSIAAGRGFVVDRYEDSAEGHIVPLEAKGSAASGEPAGGGAGAHRRAHARKTLARIVLRPTVTFAAGVSCSLAELAAMHEEAHAECFLANALRDELTIDSRLG